MRIPVIATHRVATLLLAVLVGGAAQAAPSSAREALPLSAFPRERVAIETRTSFRRLLFDAWRADTPEAREQGLMFVEESQIRPDQAMIFVYDPPEYVGMWMKNTLLPLDMLFVDEDGCIVTTRERAEPRSLRTISSGQPVALVVELKAGTIARHGIAVGDRVLRVEAGWPDPSTRCRPVPDSATR